MRTPAPSTPSSPRLSSPPAELPAAIKPSGLLKAAVGVVVFLALWEALPRLGVVSRIILSPPSAVVEAFFRDVPMVLGHLQITVAESIAAIAIAWAVGLGFGVFFGSMARTSRFLMPLLESAYALPWIVLYPLAVVWLGIGSTSKIAFAAVTASIPVLLTTTAAVSTVEARGTLLARALGASRLQMVTKVLIPFALPQVLSGLRVGAGLAVIGVVVGEMLLSLGGIGYLISYYRSIFESGYVYLGIVLGVALTVLVNLGMEWVERRIGWWDQPAS